MEIEQIVGWTPIQVDWNESYPTIEWCDMRDVAFLEPFFRETVAHCFDKDPNRTRLKTKLDKLAWLNEINPGLEPTGFIFHMSRCGSTLVSRSLSVLPENIVISEADPISSFLLKANLYNNSQEQTIKWLRLLISALGQRRFGVEKNYFIKFTSWNILKLPLIKMAFPNVPCVFIYRNPIEVMVSSLKNPRGWINLKIKYQTSEITEVAESITGFRAEEIEQMTSEEYCARVLANFCRTALGMINENALLLNYKQLPEAAWSSLLDFFQICLSPEEIDQMRNVSQLYSKDASGNKHFNNDSEAKQKEASEEIRQMANKHLMELYENLELIRLQRT
jgi:hypothetical protein